LQAFVLVASRRPLPAYAEWSGQRVLSAWSRLPAGEDVVWVGDGIRFDAVVKGAGQRGCVGELKGVGPLADLAGQLSRAEGVEALALIAFPVTAKTGR